MVLRKCIKTEDIDYMVDDCISKSMKLLSEADKMANNLAELKIRKTIERNIK
jgi:hypothetical protein